MPLVVRVERGLEPTAAAVAEAAAMAVVRLLDDLRSVEGEWTADIQRWIDGHIRKVARRARGAQWLAVTELAGMTVEHAGAEVRAFVPTPTDVVPPEIAKLQVAGLELEAGTPSADPAALAVAITPLVAMTPLKSAVQVAHAAQLARTTMSAAELERWRSSGFAVRLLRPKASTWERLIATAQVVVQDGGFTEIPPGTQTTATLFPTQMGKTGA